MTRRNKAAIDRNLQRLISIKEYVDKVPITNLPEIKNAFKGSAQMYSILINRNILYKEDGVYHWNSKIPITIKLVNTIMDEVSKRNRIFRETATAKDNLPQKSTIPATEKTPYSEPEEVSEKQEILCTKYKLQEAEKRQEVEDNDECLTIHNINEHKTNKHAIFVNVLWGMFTFKIW